MRVTLLALASILSTNALAIETPGELVMKCFSLPSSAPLKPVDMTFDVKMSDVGEVEDITVRNGFMATAETVLAGSKAIKDCAPYPLMGNQEVRINYTPIDPFKGATPAPGYGD